MHLFTTSRIVISKDAPEFISQVAMFLKIIIKTTVFLATIDSSLNYTHPTALFPTILFSSPLRGGSIGTNSDNDLVLNYNSSSTQGSIIVMATRSTLTSNLDKNNTIIKNLSYNQPILFNQKAIDTLAIIDSNRND